MPNGSEKSTTAEGELLSLLAEVRDLADGRAAVALVRYRESAAGVREATSVPWSCSFDDAAEASAFLRWMEGRRTDWLEWARLPRLVGLDAATRRIRAGAAAAAAAEIARLEAAERDERDARAIWAGCLNEGARFQVYLRRGRRENGTPCLKLQFETRVRRERVWDWMKWQTASFAGWFGSFQVHGAAPVERKILHSMMADERRLRRVGLTTGGPRPLIYWRGDAEEVDE